MLSVSSPLASAAERASRCRSRTTLLPRTSSQVVKPAQAGALTIPPPGSCRAASSARIASRALWSVVSLAESAAFVAYEASSVASALAPWSAATPRNALTRPETALTLRVHPQVLLDVLLDGDPAIIDVDAWAWGKA